MPQAFTALVRGRHWVVQGGKCAAGASSLLWFDGVTIPPSRLRRATSLYTSAAFGAAHDLRLRKVLRRAGAEGPLGSPIGRAKFFPICLYVGFGKCQAPFTQGLAGQSKAHLCAAGFIRAMPEPACPPLGGGSSLPRRFCAPGLLCKTKGRLPQNFFAAPKKDPPGRGFAPAAA